MRKINKKIGLMVFLAAFIVRLVWIFVTADAYFFSGLSAASAISAENILDGRGYSMDLAYFDKVNRLQSERLARVDIEDIPNPRKSRLVPNFTRPPGYALVLAGTFKVFGAKRYIYSRVIQVLLDSIACFILYFLVLLLAAKRVACITAWLYALFPPLAANAVRTCANAYSPFFYICAVYLLVKALREKNWQYFVISGCILGIGCYFRPEFFIFIPFLGLAVFVWHRNIVRAFVSTCVMLLVTLIFILPWGMRNYNMTGEFILSSASAGMTLWEGIGQFPNKWGATIEDADQDKIAREHGFINSLTPEANRFFMKKWLKAIKEDPLFYAGEIARRIPMIMTPRWSWGFERWDRSFVKPSFTDFKATGGTLMEFLKEYPENRIKLSCIALYQATSIIVFFLAAAGIWIARKDLRRIGMVLVIPAYLTLIYAMVFYEPRYVLPGVVGYLVFAAVALDKLYERRISRAS